MYVCLWLINAKPKSVKSVQCLLPEILGAIATFFANEWIRFDLYNYIGGRQPQTNHIIY